MTETNAAPAINVNLRQCFETCRQYMPHGDHTTNCPGIPILILCPALRSVTFEVRLGTCWLNTCYAVNPDGTPHSPETGGHGPGCPARPVKVSCSISGKTWEETQVESVTDGTPHFPPKSVRDACRSRWALVKALVLGKSKVSEFPKSFQMVPAVSEMLVQRDAVFAALADMARADKARVDAWLRVPIVVRHGTGPVNLAPDVLEWYVEHLIEQVQVMP